jgi:hypothetical protein
VSDIEKRIKVHHSLMAKGISAFLVVWVLAAVAGLAGTAVLLYVAWHFISKFW